MIRITARPGPIREFARKVGVSATLIRAQLASFAKDLAIEAERIMKDICPVGQTGWLRGSITRRLIPGAWIIGPTVPYAKYVEYGAKPSGYFRGQLIGRGGRWINPDAERVGSAAGKRLVTFPPIQRRKRVIVELPYSWFGFHPGQKAKLFIRETARIIRSLLPERLEAFAKMLVVRSWSRLLK